MGDTPKKVLQSDRCFICSTEIPKKEKIYIKNLYNLYMWGGALRDDTKNGCEGD